MADRRSTVSVYPVGVLATAKTSIRAAAAGRWTVARRHVRAEARRLVDRVQARDWRAIHTSFNGYLAEIDYPPDSLLHLHCGHGWTKRRATRRLGEYLARDNRP